MSALLWVEHVLHVQDMFATSSISNPSGHATGAMDVLVLGFGILTAIGFLLGVVVPQLLHKYDLPGIVLFSC